MAGSVVLIAVATALVAWRARSAALAVAETIVLVLASAVLSAFLIAVAIGVWEIIHHCAS